MSQMEMNRVIILQKALNGEVSVPYTAFILGISERHAYRLKAKNFKPLAQQVWPMEIVVVNPLMPSLIISVRR
ncbi:hypothetical protein MOMUL_31000 [Moorella mulderi DSM 14980]|uniref:Uncharacterized protein n=1 Tax=Moorella mulderi DSM 14980 TaxID=1122241 RepID=A0A151AK04_9FIRM|nr:hypothetical protein MOMUL_31000 [Moorella mulderi DSM 14980]